MSLPVAYGSHEPDPEGMRVLDPEQYSQIDAVYALGLYVQEMRHHNKLNGVWFPSVPKNIGRCIVPKESDLDLNITQQN